MLSTCSSVFLGQGQSGHHATDQTMYAIHHLESNYASALARSLRHLRELTEFQQEEVTQHPEIPLKIPISIVWT